MALEEVYHESGNAIMIESLKAPAYGQKSDLENSLLSVDHENTETPLPHLENYSPRLILQKIDIKFTADLV